MFSTDISIKRKLPVINGFVSIPDGQQLLRTKLTPLDVIALIPGSSLVRIDGSGSHVVNIGNLDPTAFTLNGTAKSQYQLWVQLPEHDRLVGPPEDWFATLREAASV